MSVFRISRCTIIRNGRHPAIFANFSSDSSKKDSPENVNSSTEEKAKKAEKPEKKEVTSKRLNELLAMMTTETDLSVVKDVIKPRSSAEKKERQKEYSNKNKKEPDSNKKAQNIAEAAKKVAETLDGDKKKTESELLTAFFKKSDGEGDQNLNTLLGGMKVDKSRSPPFERRSDVVRKSLGQNPNNRNNENLQTDEWTQRPKRDQRNWRDVQSKTGPRVNVDLFGGKPLGIFTNNVGLQDSPDILKTWNYLHHRELKLAVTHPPKNYFEKMALWTEQGKLWKFPIDNEQGMDEEAKNYFTEHVFLERHLESWCPTKGPIRHFMELVCVGLSKNPYFTVTQKKEHIEWFREYFAGKKELLDSVIIDSDATKELQQ